MEKENNSNSEEQHPSCKHNSEMNRRDFIGAVIRFGMLATLAGMVLPAISYLAPVTKRGPAGGLTDVGGVDDIPVGGAKKVIVGGSAVLILRTTQRIKAFSAVCTHLGCLVGWDAAKREINCPCHGGTFDTEGRVVSGPPSKPLPSYTVSVVNGRIMVKA